MTEGVDHKALAISLNQRTWALLEKEERTEQESDELIHVAHASLWHWLQAGGPVQQQRGEWLVRRTYVVLGHGESALFHARRTFDLTKRHSADLQDFDHAYAFELLARALDLNNDPEASRMWEKALDLGSRIKGDKDREIFEGDVKAIPFRAACDLNTH